MNPFRWFSSKAWSNGFWWGFKLGRLAVEYRLQYEYKKLSHAPRRTRAAARSATLYAHEESELLISEGENDG